MATAFLVFAMMIGLTSFVLLISRLKMRRIEMERLSRTDNTLAADELEELIRRAVADATEPIRADVEALTARLDAADATIPLPGSDDRFDPQPESRTIGRTRTSSSS